MNTEASPITPLTAGDIPAGLTLSACAGWNQNAADWRALLHLGQGFGIRVPDATGHEVLAASAIVLPYGDAFAWVSMVLVLPEFRRRGYASVLLRHAIGELAGRGLTPILDATPAGHEVYLQEGFADTWGFARYRCERCGSQPAIAARAASTRPLQMSDWPAIEAIDTPAFGARRIAMLRSLALRLPNAARVIEQHGQLCGYIFGRDGREATQIGPLVAPDPPAAACLMQDVLSRLDGTVVVDLLDHQKALLPWLQQQGFVFQRPFTRMVHGLAVPVAPGDPRRIALAAGPELG